MIDVEKIIYEALNCNEKYIIPWNKNAHNQYTKNIAIENFIKNYCKNTNVKFRRYDKGAFYFPAEDEIAIPPRCWFNDITEYYRVVFHEIYHSTGIFARYNRRDFNYDPLEELIAEIGTMVLMNYFDIENISSYNNALAYCKGWIWEIIYDNNFNKILKLDKELDIYSNYILAKGGIE